jgi:hypothetical protein
LEYNCLLLTESNLLMSENQANISAENSAVIERIFSSIDSVGQKMESTIDLKDDVYPFMLSTLAKIKQLALVPQEFQTQYELMQISMNYLPRVFDSYCGLPMEYRHKKAIKNGKTARELLLEDLKIFKKQVMEIESNIYKKVEQQMQVNSRVIRDKYEHQFQLADEVQALENDGFVAQFDYDKYAKTPDYKNIEFKKNPDKAAIAKQEAMANIRAVSNNGIKATQYVFSKLGKGLSIVGSFIAGFFAGLIELVFEAFMPVVTISVIGGLFISLGMLMVSQSKESNYTEAIRTTANSSYQVMSVSMIPEKEFSNFVNQRQEMMFKESSLARKDTVFTTDKANSSFTLAAKDLSAYKCKGLIDQKKLNYDKASMTVNGIALPQYMVISNYYAYENDNHKLCHLEEGNRISIEMNNKTIFDAAQKEKALGLKELEARVLSYEKEIAQAKIKVKEMSSDSSGYKYTNSMIDQLKERIVKIKEITKDMK